MVATDVTTHEKEKEGDLEKEEFIEDYKRVNKLLDEAIADSQGFAKCAKENLVDSSKKQFKIEGDVPVWRTLIVKE